VVNEATASSLFSHCFAFCDPKLAVTADRSEMLLPANLANGQATLDHVWLAAQGLAAKNLHILALALMTATSATKQL